MHAADAPLRPLPATFAATRDALHRVAEAIVAPARVAATGNEIALEAAPGGFGTPPFPHAALAGLPGDGLDPAPVAVDPEAARALGALYAFAWEVLGVLRAEAPAGADASPVRLWPEHFDAAFEQGPEAQGRRAGYGVSPGDAEHPEPYLYVTPWTPQPASPAWTATGFEGAELGYAALLDAPDARAAALAFLRDRRAALLGA